MMGIIDKYKQKVTQKLNLSKGHFIMWLRPRYDSTCFGITLLRRTAYWRVHLFWLA